MVFAIHLKLHDNLSSFTGTFPIQDVVGSNLSLGNQNQMDFDDYGSDDGADVDSPKSETKSPRKGSNFYGMEVGITKS